MVDSAYATYNPEFSRKNMPPLSLQHCETDERHSSNISNRSQQQLVRTPFFRKCALFKMCKMKPNVKPGKTNLEVVMCLSCNLVNV